MRPLLGLFVILLVGLLGGLLDRNPVPLKRPEQNHLSLLQPPTPSNGEQRASEQAKGDDREKPATDNQRGTEPTPFIVKILNAPNGASETQNQQPGSLKKTAPDWWGPEWSIVWATLILALIALTQLLMFLAQLRYMRVGMNDAKTASEAAKLAATAALLGQRARIEIIPAWETDGPRRQYGWGADAPDPQYKFSTRMENAGHMPAINIRNTIDYIVLPGEIPSDFVFPDDAPHLSQAGVLGTSRPLLGPHIPPNRYVTADEMEKMRREEIRFYFFGWVRYNDGFPDTPERTTKFCYWVRVTGNPEAPVVFIPNKAYNHAD